MFRTRFLIPRVADAHVFLSVHHTKSNPRTQAGDIDQVVAAFEDGAAKAKKKAKNGGNGNGNGARSLADV